MKPQLYIIGHKHYATNSIPTLMFVKILLDGWFDTWDFTIDVGKSYHAIGLIHCIKNLTTVE